jgi:hypothetical protein
MNANKVKTVGLAVLMTVGTACAAVIRPNGTVYARFAPPAERIEVVSVAPSSEHVWVAGHWAWRNNNYEWEPGRWVRAESGHREWIAGHYEQDSRGWFYVEGRWR